MIIDERHEPAEPPRLFVAVSLPAKIRAELHEIGRKAKEKLRFHKWTHPDDIHITLKFLGETSSNKVDAVVEALRASAAGYSLQPFELHVSGMGVFGPPARPTILWAGVKGDLRALSELHDKVEAATSALGYDKEDRSFRPHLTLARRYNGSSSFNRRELEAAEKLLPPGELNWTVRSFTLYRSHLGRTPMYEAIAEFPLADPNQTDRASQ